MTQKPIYIYAGTEGKIQTPIQLEGITPESTLVRLMADYGKILVKGDVKTSCIDVEESDIPNWIEEVSIVTGG
jgi:hypothetical protein